MKAEQLVEHTTCSFHSARRPFIQESNPKVHVHLHLLLFEFPCHPILYDYIHRILEDKFEQFNPPEIIPVTTIPEWG